MNMRTTLMLMAASVAPIYAQQPSAPAEQVYTSLATPAPATSATPAQRAAAYPALAHIPAEIEALFTINNIGSTARTICELSNEMPPAEALQLQSVALAAGEGLLASLQSLEPWLCKSAEEESFPKIWEAGAADPAKGIITRLVKDYSDKVHKAAMDNMANIKLPPVYAVLTSTPEGAATLNEWYNLAMQSMQESMTPGEDEAVEINGYSGIKHNLKGETYVHPDYDFDYETGEVTKKELTADQKAVSDELDKRSIYVLLKQQGNTLLAIVCEDPATIRQSNSPETSVLATDKLAAADANLSKTPEALCWVAGGLNSVSNKMQFAPYIGMADIVQNTFAELATTDSANATTWQAAAAGAKMLTNTFTTLLLPESHTPDLIQVWHGDNSLEIQYNSSANGISYAPGKLVLTSQADKPGNILYMESTFYESMAGIPTCDQLLDAVVSVVDGFFATIPAEAQAATAEQIAMGKAFLPEVKQVFSSLQTIGSGMSNSVAFTMDSAGSMPMILGGTPGNTAAMPRLCLYTGVADRSKLSQGWDTLVKTASEVAAKLGSDPAVVNMLPIVPTPLGNAISYSISLPWFTPDMVPNITVSDTAFTAGTSSNYNAEVAAAATGSMPFTGAVCSIKFAPLATTARGIANELEKAVQQEKEPLTLGVEGEAAADEDFEVEEEQEQLPTQVCSTDEEDYIEEDDYEEEDRYVYREPSPAEQKASQADDIADACESVAKYVERLDSTATVDNGTCTWRISIKFKK
ncbi:MAG: hypothetical protein IJN29_14065 [Akkermansia sp.]|nr:hypothetical protein [Akkermansia sp.]